MTTTDATHTSDAATGEGLARLRAVFPLRRCPECGYARDGLPDLHPCPECGATPEADAIVLFTEGETASTHWDWRSILLAFGLVGAIMALNLAEPLLRRMSWPAGGLLTPVGLGAFAVTFWWWTRRLRAETGGGPTQVRLGPRGYAVRVGLGPVRWVPWPAGSTAEIREPFFAGRGTFELQVRPGRVRFLSRNRVAVAVRLTCDAPARRLLLGEVRRWVRDEFP